MAIKYRSKVDYAQIFAGDKQGYNLGLDGAMFLKVEPTARTFTAPSIGTQGSSIGDDTASTDITGQSDTNFRIAVDGGSVVAVTLSLTGKNTGALIAAEMETKINAALLAAGQDGRVWVDFTSGDAHYTIYSQKTGTSSTVVVTDGATANIADLLKIGTANGGTEAAGTNDADFLLYTSGGATFSQPIESNNHRSGRFHVGIIKKKKVAEFSFQTMVNMSGDAGASLDTAVKVLWKNLLGKETVTASTSIKYEQDLPNFTFSLVRVSTIFGEYYTGGYVKDATLTLNGNAPATVEWKGKASKRTIAGIAKLNGAVSASTTITLDAGQNDRFDVGAPVMVVDDDGRTIVAGADGTLTIASVSTVAETLTVSSAVTADDNGYLVPWHAGAVQQTGRDAIYTDLLGSFKLTSAGSAIDVNKITLSMKNDHNDLDNYFGNDANAGFVAGNRATHELSVEFDLTSQETFAEVVQTSQFSGFNPEIILGDSGSGRYLKITAPKWIVSVPTIEVPENGPTPVTLTGNLYQSVAGQQDPIKVEFL